jgi:hypothetical protein
MIDVETDGPIPGDYSMIEIGAVLVRPPLQAAPTFRGYLAPISPAGDPEALKVTGRTRDEILKFPSAGRTMLEFSDWVQSNNVGKHCQFISDNNGFDYMFVAWYLYHFVGTCVFRHTSTNLGSLYKGLIKNTFKNFKHLRVTKHTHNPVDDAMGNAEALVHMRDVMGLNILLE